MPCQARPGILKRLRLASVLLRRLLRPRIAPGAGAPAGAPAGAAPAPLPAVTCPCPCTAPTSAPAGQVRDGQPAARLVAGRDACGVPRAPPQPGWWARELRELGGLRAARGRASGSRLGPGAKAGGASPAWTSASGTNHSFSQPALRCRCCAPPAAQKCLAALASGGWLVGPGWIDACQEAGALVPEVGTEAALLSWAVLLLHSLAALPEHAEP